MDINNQIPKIDFSYKRYGFEIFSLSTLSRRLVSRDHDPFKPHLLKFYAILFITGGEGSHFIDFEDFNYRNGTILFLSKGQVHAFDKSKHYKGELILFTEDFLVKNLSDAERSSFSWLYNYPVYSPQLLPSKDQFDEFGKVVENLKHEFNREDDHYKVELLRNILKQFLIISERCRGKLDFKMDSNYSTEFVRLQSLLIKNIKTERSVNFYSKALGISPKKMNNITRDIVHQTSKNYITSILILEVKRLLISTNRAIDDIAFSFGFNEPTNFVKFFKKHAGYTPLQCRNTYKT